MLANHPIDPMILATDLAVARRFYGDLIGLELLLENDDFLTFALSAWLIDPHGDSIGLLQFKAAETD